ncbi:hypothetical protein B0H10DRAFT_2224112 [Mycena sp. CBHHK59/15]|nr:hypothetical protein B0H10DRAFT_2224112 [Mycena sp. CBHHK59/15]
MAYRRARTLEGIRMYLDFGLTHFGTNTAGVNSMRRYLCEALSFQYRYIPIGLREHLPRCINDRHFAGATNLVSGVFVADPLVLLMRQHLETLLASGDSRDWVRISEMLLGTPEARWFTPKHKSHGYEIQG